MSMKQEDFYSQDQINGINPVHAEGFLKRNNRKAPKGYDWVETKIWELRRDHQHKMGKTGEYKDYGGDGSCPVIKCVVCGTETLIT